VSNEVVVTFDDSGGCAFVYEDAENVLGEDVHRLIGCGDYVTKRASYVEPSSYLFGTWTADMSPVGGPILGPFSMRTEALMAEREWLRDERGL
jgi:hypothetical protein